MDPRARVPSRRLLRNGYCELLRRSSTTSEYGSRFVRHARPINQCSQVRNEHKGFHFISEFAKLRDKSCVLPERCAETHSGMATIFGKVLPELGGSSAPPSERLVARAAAVQVSEQAAAAMERYAQGDESAFASVYDSVAPRVHAYLLRQTRDRAIADDLLQQTLLQIHRKRGTYAAGLPVLPWAFAIARRLYIDECRRRKTDALWSARDVNDDDRQAWVSADDELASREAVQLVEAELSRMPGNQRVAFELLKVDGLSQQEAAQMLGTTVSAVKLRAFRAYSALRSVLGRPLEPSGSVKQRRQA